MSTSCASSARAPHAGALPSISDDALTKAVTDIRLDIAGVRGEQVIHRWMPGCMLSANVAVMFKLFTH